MTHIRLTAGAEDGELIRFTLKTLNDSDFRVKRMQGVRYERWELYSEEKSFGVRLTQRISEYLRIFTKYRFLKGEVGGFANPYRFHALLGVMIGVDRKSEREQIARIVRSERHISLPQIKCFKMDGIYDEWRAFADFVAAFRSGDWDEKHVFAELIPVLQILGLNDEVGSGETGLTLDGETGTISERGVALPIPPLSGDANLDLITALTSLRPDTVTVTNPKRLSKEVLSTLQEMGQAEREVVNNS